VDSCRAGVQGRPAKKKASARVAGLESSFGSTNLEEVRVRRLRPGDRARNRCLSMLCV